ncbi:MAG: 4Fe-4S dicluster domain-containing protein [Candidatus Zhuqueibacterota bacterium]
MNLDRRDFIKSLGSLSLVMVPDLSQGPLRKLFPMLIPAEEIIPGVPYWYVSTCRECPAGCGVLLKVRNDNVIKIEGNPNHPVNCGGLCARGQAALQELYSAERLQAPMKIPASGPRERTTWDAVIPELKAKMGAGKTVVLSGDLSGSQKSFVEKWIAGIAGNAELVMYEPFHRAGYRRANEIVFGKNVDSRYHLDKADYVLSFGADFMETWQSPVALSRDFSDARRFRNGRSAKLAYVGIADSITATNADEEYKINPLSETVLLLALASQLLEKNSRLNMESRERQRWRSLLGKYTPELAAEYSGLTVQNVVHLAEQLLAFKNSVLLCGESLAAHEHATASLVAANLVNYFAGNYGVTISLGSPDATVGSMTALEQLLREMEAGQVAHLIMYNTNPAFTYPDRERLAAAFKKVGLKIALATTPNETTELADYALPVSHAIETWGIESPQPDVFSLVQPGMKPVFDSKPMEEALIALAPVASLPDSLEKFIEDEWQSIFRLKPAASSFPDNWKELLLTGGVWLTSEAVPPAPALSSRLSGYLNALAMPEKSAGVALLVNFSHRFFDGRGANKPWLWEVPNALSHTVWDTPLRIHPKRAEPLALKEGDIVAISANGRTIEAPVLLTEHVHPSVVAMEFGAGHAHYGAAAVKETGNPWLLLSGAGDDNGDVMLVTRDIQMKKTGKWRKLVRIQGGYDQGERNIIQQMHLDHAIQLENSHAKRIEPHHPQIYPVHEHKKYDWTMVVDLSACIGCGACAVACYAENNLATVGKTQCDNGREMAWLRIERFDVDGRSRFIPVMCQHCENAPCETVCPVYATVHSDEGLNVQVYNRCVGTRYCSNNCPYKARRFNFFHYTWEEPAKRQLNPDIYHRPKGVMEKCTFCVHRIRKAKEDAKLEGRVVADGEVMPACAQSCPTQAITFGNINDPESKVSKLLHDFRGYQLFENLNTQPSVIYLKGIKHE